MIEQGSKVSMHYTLKVDGRLVDTSSGKEPLTYTQGRGEIIVGLEEALAGLDKGDKKNVNLPPEKGYGNHKKEAVQKVPRSAFQEAESLQVGDMVSGQMSGRQFRAAVVEVGREQITLDMNHPLAGKTLNFQIEIVSVK